MHAELSLPMRRYEFARCVWQELWHPNSRMGIKRLNVPIPGRLHHGLFHQRAKRTESQERVPCKGSTEFQTRVTCQGLSLALLTHKLHPRGPARLMMSRNFAVAFTS